eukprot:scaffold21131_cov134-Isochrysis_galbana.AAC.6
MAVDMSSAGLWRGKHALGCCVGLCCDKRSSLSMWSNVTCVSKGVAVARRHTETQHSPAAKGPCERSYTPSMFRALQNQSTRNMVECEGPRSCKTLITHEERLNGAKGPAAREVVIICTRAQIQRRTEGQATDCWRHASRRSTDCPGHDPAKSSAPCWRTSTSRAGEKKTSYAVLAHGAPAGGAIFAVAAHARNLGVRGELARNGARAFAIGGVDPRALKVWSPVHESPFLLLLGQRQRPRAATAARRAQNVALGDKLVLVNARPGGDVCHNDAALIGHEIVAH